MKHLSNNSYSEQFAILLAEAETEAKAIIEERTKIALGNTCDLKDYKKKKFDDLLVARAHKNDSPEAKAKWKDVIAELKEIDYAIESGATTIKEFRDYVTKKQERADAEAEARSILNERKNYQQKKNEELNNRNAISAKPKPLKAEDKIAKPELNTEVKIRKTETKKSKYHNPFDINFRWFITAIIFFTLIFWAVDSCQEEHEEIVRETTFEQNLHSIEKESSSENMDDDDDMYSDDEITEEQADSVAQMDMAEAEIAASGSENDVKEILRSKFDIVYNLGNGFYKIGTNGKYGLANEQGQVVAAPIYSDIYSQDSKTGLIKVETDGMYGFLNAQGDEVIRPRFDFIYDFSHGFYKIEQSGKYGLVNEQGQVVAAPIYSYISSQDSKTGLARVEKDGKYGFLNAQGEEVIKPKYDYIYSSDSNSGLTKVKIDDKYGFINLKTMKEVTPCIYTYIYGLSDGLYKVKQGRKTGYLNQDGSVNTEPE